MTGQSCSRYTVSITAVVRVAYKPEHDGICAPPRPTVATGIGSTVCSVRGDAWSARHGKAADSEQILMEDYHRSGREVFSDLIKVGEND
jgi:hypothetical protein